MEFSEKIQKLRNKNNLTQESLAEKLYVSRTAVSKWESGKGYPNIETLKDIAKLFNITIDELLSNQEILTLAEKEKNLIVKKTNNLIYGVFDLISILFIFLPLYVKKTDNFIYSVSLFKSDLSMKLKIIYLIILLVLTVIGITELILNFTNHDDKKSINKLSLIIQVISILIFIITRQVYLTVIMFILLIMKVLILFKNKSLVI